MQVSLDQSLTNDPETVDAIECTDILLRFQFSRLRRAILRWWHVLKRGGTLTLTVTDTPHNLIELLREMGFGDLCLEDVGRSHRILTGRKSDWIEETRLAWHLAVQPEETVLDVGPGNHPCPFATHYLDISNDFTRDLGGKPLDIGTVESLPYPDQSFDVAIAAHVLEHCDHPERALAELQRVGKRGVVECPHVAKDWLLQEGHVHPRWQVVRSGTGVLTFVALSRDQVRFFNDETVRNQMYRLTQYPGAEYGYLGFALRRLFWRGSSLLNPVISWDATHEAKCQVVR